MTVYCRGCAKESPLWEKPERALKSPYCSDPCKRRVQNEVKNERCKDKCRQFDERGRRVWRIRKHDIEEFQAIVQRHGCYKRDLEKFSEALLKSKKAADSLFKEDDATVRFGSCDKDGKITYTEPIKHSDFVEACEKVGKRRGVTQ